MRNLASWAAIVLLAFVLAGAWIMRNGPESSYWTLRKYARQNLAAKAAGFVDRASLERSFAREAGRPYFLSVIDPLNVPGVALGTSLVCEPVASLLDGLGPGMPFMTQPCSGNVDPVIRVRSDGVSKAYLTPEWACEKQPRVELEFRRQGIKWKLAGYKPLSRSRGIDNEAQAEASVDSTSQTK